MKIRYDRETDTLVIQLQPGADVAESDEMRPGIVCDLDREGNIVSLEILDASRRVTRADQMEFEVSA